MSLRTRIQALSAAAMLALAVASLTVGDADAKPKRPTNGTTCSLPGAAVAPPSENDFEFYPVGAVEFAVKPNGDLVTIQCQADGTWKVIGATKPSRALPTGPLLPLTPQ